MVILRNSGGTTPVSGVPLAYVAKGTQTYQDANVISGTTYSYILRAEDTLRNKSISFNEVSATVSAVPTIATPILVPSPTVVPEPAPTPPPAPAPTVAPAPPITPVQAIPDGAGTLTPPVTRPVLQSPQIIAEARRLFEGTVETIATAVGTSRDASAEINTKTRLVERIVSLGLSDATKEKITSFVHYGTESTQILGAGERAGSVASFVAAFGKDPVTAADLEDIIKIANGRFPSQTNPEREAAVAFSFRRVYKRAPDRANSYDNAAIIIMAYGLRQEEGRRNLASERAAIGTFASIYKKIPSSTLEWDIVRAIAYSGAAR